MKLNGQVSKYLTFEVIYKNLFFTAQIQRAPSFQIDNPYCSKETNSNFECYNACINEQKCVYVQKRLIDGINCFLSDKVIQNGTVVKVAESATVLGK